MTSFRTAALALAALALACAAPTRQDDDPAGPDAGQTSAPDAGRPDPAACGNGLVDPGEACDPAIFSGPGSCPAECGGGSACAPLVLSGSAADCTAVCHATPVAACQNGDGCCPAGCTAAHDADCGAPGSCGNGVLDAAEACDPAIPSGAGACPTDCNDGNVCTADRVVGSASACTAACANSAITSCRSGDGCCPSGCTFARDADCPGCGNGVLEGSEICDGNCPTGCDDSDACTVDTLTGSASGCNVQCHHQPVAACVPGDGCCPSGCTSPSDTDCAATTCSPACRAGQHCVGTSCVADAPGIGSPCTADTECGANGVCVTQLVNGWPQGYCSATCLFDGECGAGGWCRGGDGFFTQGYCFKGCTADSACRTPDYGCYDRFRASRPICAPVGIGAGAVGAPCTTVRDCAGGPFAGCYTEAGDGFKGGYCTLVLASTGTRSCPAGSHLADVDATSHVGECYADCSGLGTVSTCRSAGYQCLDGDKAGGLECLPAATGTGSVGAACTATWDCSGGARGVCGMAANGWPGGYCLLECNSGSCPTGTTCGQLNPNSATSHFCLQNCSGSCSRSGYSCKAYAGSTGTLCSP